MHNFERVYLCEMNDPFVELRNFIEMKLQNINVERLFYTAEYYSDYDSASEYMNEKIDDIAYDIGASWGACGCTKSVFFFKEFPNYVFKFPFRGTCLLEFDEYGFFDETGRCKDFCNCHLNDHNAWDYCEAEARLYHAACEYGVDKFFAGTYYIGEYCGLPLYVSEFRKHVSASVRGSQRSSCLAQELVDYVYHTPLSQSTISNMIEFTSFEAVKNLVDFIEEFCIDDLHRGNLGSTDNGMICIIDYSGFDE